jgi:inner membrane protein
LSINILSRLGWFVDYFCFLWYFCFSVKESIIMPTVITHAVVGGAFGMVLPGDAGRWRTFLGGIFCATIADTDVLAFKVGIPYGHILGHRGISHSFLFALVVSIIVVCCLFRKVKIFSAGWWGLVNLMFLAGVSHGVLDAMTNGGMGVAFLAPLDNTRYFLPWTPIHVSPLGLSRHVLKWKLQVLGFEMIHICLPTSLLVLITRIVQAKSKTTINNPPARNG